MSDRPVPRPPATRPPGAVLDRAPLPRCECGKVLCHSKADAVAKAKAAAKAHDRDAPVRFYTCEHGSWHWSERYVAYKDCLCGHRAYHDDRAAWKTAERRNTRFAGIPITARAYRCAYNGAHTILYPAGEPLRQCKGCGEIAYREETVAQVMIEYLNENHPELGNEYVIYTCAATHRYHVARVGDVPVKEPQ